MNQCDPERYGFSVNKSQLMDWNPPPHKPMVDLHVSSLFAPISEGHSNGNLPSKVQFLISDGGHDVNKQCALSGEPLIPHIREPFKLRDPYSAVKCQELTVEALERCRAYSDYWESATGDDGSIPRSFSIGGIQSGWSKITESRSSR
jgi:amidase